MSHISLTDKHKTFCGPCRLNHINCYLKLKFVPRRVRNMAMQGQSLMQMLEGTTETFENTRKDMMGYNRPGPMIKFPKL